MRVRLNLGDRVVTLPIMSVSIDNGVSELRFWSNDDCIKRIVVKDEVSINDEEIVLDASECKIYCQFEAELEISQLADVRKYITLLSDTSEE